MINVPVAGNERQWAQRSRNRLQFASCLRAGGWTIECSTAAHAKLSGPSAERRLPAIMPIIVPDRFARHTFSLRSPAAIGPTAAGSSFARLRGHTMPPRGLDARGRAYTRPSELGSKRPQPVARKGVEGPHGNSTLKKHSLPWLRHTTRHYSGAAKNNRQHVVYRS